MFAEEEEEEKLVELSFVLAVLRPLIKSQFEFSSFISFFFPSLSLSTDLLTFSLFPIENLEGNLDANTVEEHHLEMPIVGVRWLRLVPLSNYTRTVCLRFELYGCPYYGKCSGLTPFYFPFPCR